MCVTVLVSFILFDLSWVFFVFICFCYISFKKIEESALRHQLVEVNLVSLTKFDTYYYFCRIRY